MSSPSPDHAFSFTPSLSGPRVPERPSRFGFWATLAGTAVAVCAASVGVILLVAYLAGAGAPR